MVDGRVQSTFIKNEEAAIFGDFHMEGSYLSVLPLFLNNFGPPTGILFEACKGRKRWIH